MKRIEITDQKVPGQKDIFAPVLSGVPGQMTRCPCGFGAYDAAIKEKKNVAKACSTSAKYSAQIWVGHMLIIFTFRCVT